MGTGLNLAVKIVDAQTNKTIRYVFVREKTKELGQEYTTRQYMLQVGIISGFAAIVSYLYFF